MAECWVKDSGICKPEEVLSRVNECLREDENMGGAVAFFTDHFDAAFPEGIETLLADPSHLLEARVYGKNRELWIHRGCIGDDFAWRLAADDGVPADARRVETQWLDIDDSRGISFREDHVAKLCTTGGGHYVLPVKKDQKAVKLAVYYRYDKDGCAHAADYRMIGFEGRQD